MICKFILKLLYINRLCICPTKTVPQPFIMASYVIEYLTHFSDDITAKHLISSEQLIGFCLKAIRKLNAILQRLRLAVQRKVTE